MIGAFAGHIARTLPYVSIPYFVNWLSRGDDTSNVDRMRNPLGRSTQEMGLDSASKRTGEAAAALATLGAGAIGAYQASKKEAPQAAQQEAPAPEAPPVPVAPAMQEQGPPATTLQTLLTPDVLQRLTPDQSQQVNNRVRMIEQFQANPTKTSEKQIQNLLGSIEKIIAEEPKKGVVQEERERFAKAYPEQQSVQQAQAPVPAKQLKPFTNVPQATADQFNKALALAVNSLQQKPIRFRTEEGGYSTDLAAIKKPTKSQTDSIFKRLVQADPSIAESLNKLSGPQRRIARNQLVGNFLEQTKGSKVPAQVQRIESARDKVQRLTESRRLNDLAKEREWLAEPAALGSGTNYDLLLKMIREEL